MSTFVAPIGTGFGDVLISLPVVQALLDRGDTVFLVTRSFRQEGISSRIVGLCGEIRETDLRIGPDDLYINLRAHPIQTDHIWGSPEFEQKFGITRIEKIISVIARDWELDISFEKLRPLSFKLRTEISGQVVFVPGTDGFFKHWPKTYWLELKESLESSGLPVTLLGRPEESPAVKELIACGFTWMPTPSAADAIDAISSALAVVAVDTGLMHVAVQQNIPTISFVHPDMFHHRSAPNSFQFIGERCPAECGRDNEIKTGTTEASGLDVNLKFHYHLCPLGFRLANLESANIATDERERPGPFNCMSGITPIAVLDRMKKQGLLKT